MKWRDTFIYWVFCYEMGLLCSAVIRRTVLYVLQPIWYLTVLYVLQPIWYLTVLYVLQPIWYPNPNLVPRGRQ